MKANIIEDNKNNVQYDTTGTDLDTCIIARQNIRYLQDWLAGISLMMFYIYKLQIKRSIVKEHYDELTSNQPLQPGDS
jgi:hypothetical protein